MPTTAAPAIIDDIVRGRRCNQRGVEREPRPTEMSVNAPMTAIKYQICRAGLGVIGTWRATLFCRYPFSSDLIRVGTATGQGKFSG